MQITVEIPDYLDDETELADMVVSKIASQFMPRIGSETVKRVDSLLDQSIKDAIASKVEGLLEQKTLESFHLTNSYGEKKGEATNLREIILKKAESHLNDKVKAKDGGKPGYNDATCSRVEWMVKSAVDQAIKQEIACIHEEVRDRATKAMKDFAADRESAGQA